MTVLARACAWPELGRRAGEQRSALARARAARAGAGLGAAGGRELATYGRGPARAEIKGGERARPKTGEAGGEQRIEGGGGRSATAVKEPPSRSRKSRPALQVPRPDQKQDHGRTIHRARRAETHGPDAADATCLRTSLPGGHPATGRARRRTSAQAGPHQALAARASAPRPQPGRRPEPAPTPPGPPPVRRTLAPPGPRRSTRRRVAVPPHATPTPAASTRAGEVSGAPAKPSAFSGRAPPPPPAPAAAAAEGGRDPGRLC
nr:uncharacterized protein LOC127340422 [Lolium perenne]